MRNFHSYFVNTVSCMWGPRTVPQATVLGTVLGTVLIWGPRTVPQGTVLDPQISDFPQRVRSKVRLFADDYLLYRPIH